MSQTQDSTGMQLTGQTIKKRNDLTPEISSDRKSQHTVFTTAYTGEVSAYKADKQLDIDKAMAIFAAMRKRNIQKPKRTEVNRNVVDGKKITIFGLLLHCRSDELETKDAKKFTVYYATLLVLVDKCIVPLQSGEIVKGPGGKVVLLNAEPEVAFKSVKRFENHVFVKEPVLNYQLVTIKTSKPVPVSAGQMVRAEGVIVSRALRYQSDEDVMEVQDENQDIVPSVSGGAILGENVPVQQSLWEKQMGSTNATNPKDDQDLDIDIEMENAMIKESKEMEAGKNTESFNKSSSGIETQVVVANPNGTLRPTGNVHGSMKYLTVEEAEKISVEQAKELLEADIDGPVKFRAQRIVPAEKNDVQEYFTDDALYHLLVFDEKIQELHQVIDGGEEQSGMAGEIRKDMIGLEKIGVPIKLPAKEEEMEEEPKTTIEYVGGFAGELKYREKKGFGAKVGFEKGKYYGETFGNISFPLGMIVVLPGQDVNTMIVKELQLQCVDPFKKLFKKANILVEQAYWVAPQFLKDVYMLVVPKVDDTLANDSIVCQVQEVVFDLQSWLRTHAYPVTCEFGSRFEDALSSVLNADCTIPNIYRNNADVRMLNNAGQKFNPRKHKCYALLHPKFEKMGICLGEDAEENSSVLDEKVQAIENWVTMSKDNNMAELPYVVYMAFDDKEEM